MRKSIIYRLTNDEGENEKLDARGERPANVSGFGVFVSLIVGDVRDWFDPLRRENQQSCASAQSDVCGEIK